MSRLVKKNTFSFILGVAVLIAAIFFLKNSRVAASSGFADVAINEIMWDGIEYLELLNYGDSPTSLTNWRITRQQADKEEQSIVLFPENIILEANNFLLIEKNESATTIPADLIASSLILVNTGEKIRLYDDEDNIIDEANWFGAWYAGENTAEGKAMERNYSVEDGTDSSNWHTATATIGGRVGTPGAKNSEPIINDPPIAAISARALANYNEVVTFSAEDSSDPENNDLTYAWLFGDGESAAGLEVIHTFNNEGKFTVSLTVSDGELSDTTTHKIIISAPIFSDEIVINEALPNPTGDDTAGEFIELKNIGTTKVDLSGWQLDDIEGGSTPFTIRSGVTLSAGEIIVFYRPETKIALNNSSDEVRLLTPLREEQSVVVYDSSSEQISINRLPNGSYSESTTITPGSANIITEPLDDEDVVDDEDDSNKTTSGNIDGDTITTVALADVRSQKPGTMIQSVGIVSAPPGTFGDSVFYLAGSGIQVYFSKKDFPKLALGDEVQVIGELSSIRGEARLKLSSADDVEMLSKQEPPTPHLMETGAINEDTEGTLVTIQGKVSSTSGDTFYVDDGSGEVKIYIKPDTEIDKPDMKKGTNVTITGIVSQTTSGYRILPRFQEDIRFGLVAGLTTFPATGWQLTFLIILWLIISVVLILARRANEPLLLLHE